RDFPETLKNSEFRLSLQTRLQKLAQTEPLTPSQKIALSLFLEDLGISKISELQDELSHMTEIPQVIVGLEILPFQKRTLSMIRKIRKDWEEIYLDLIFSAEQNLLRDFVLQELNTPTTQDVLKEKLNALLIHPLSFAEVFVWYFQKIIDSKSELPFAKPDGQNRFFETLLVLLDHLERKTTYRDLVKKILSLLTANRYKIVRQIMAQSNLEEVKEYLLLATKCKTLTDHDIKILHSLGEVVHPSLARLRKEKEQGGTNEDQIIWTTQEGYQKLQSRIQQIATVETVHNAKEIETARSHGDLRENAEFKAALERRDRLQAELKLLSDQIAKARILTPEDVSTDEVSVGSIVHCTDAKGEHLRFTLLGPWDADPDQQILSFQSKLAQAMKGKNIGEKFVFQGETFTISDIENYFDQKEGIR
ncbi:MAG: GreA/GreB family elongation factor, partial [Chlamydiia bacterium]|nr:GreA/GreB family elongation factor [Chlamydiia bacterium]